MGENEKKESDVGLDDEDFQHLLVGLLQVDPSEISDKKPPKLPRKRRKKNKNYRKYMEEPD